MSRKQIAFLVTTEVKCENCGAVNGATQEHQARPSSVAHHIEQGSVLLFPVTVKPPPGWQIILDQLCCDQCSGAAARAFARILAEDKAAP